MGTIADKLLYLQNTKIAIKDAIVAKGVDIPIGTKFRDYSTKIGDITSGSVDPTPEPYVRNPNWLTLPDNINGVQKVSILNAVLDTDSEFVAFIFQGAYTVDWGDGTSGNFASGIKAEHKYDYTNINLNSDTVATLGYKQCIITITPQSGQNLTLINLNTFHSVIGSGTSSDMTTGFLDLRINSLSCSNLTISAVTDYVKHLILQQCIIGEISITTTSHMFNSCYSLQSVPLFDLRACTNTSYMFNSCTSLQSVPLFDLRACKDASYMFSSCTSLQSVPLFDLSLCTNASTMFASCTSLQSVPLFDLRACTSATNMFASCYSLQSVPSFDLRACTNATNMFSYCGGLQSVPLFNLSLCTNASQMFYNCTSLQSVQLFDLSLCTNASSMFSSCTSLQSVPLFNLSLCKSTSYMFNGCYSLQSVPLFDLRACTNTSSMFASCTSLQSVPLFDLRACKDASYMFNSCYSLQSVPSLDLIVCTNVSGMFNGCYSVKKMTAKIKVSFSLTNAKLSATALNDMYTALPTVAGQTVTVTGNYGTATDTPSIATAKGWTVTG